MLIEPDHGFLALASDFGGKRVLVMGTAGGVWDEVGGLGRIDRVVAVNLSGVLYPGLVDIWVVNGDARELDGWRLRRPDRAGILVGGDINVGGDTAHYSTRMAIACGAAGVVLAGVPLDPAAGHVSGQPSARLASYRKAWSDWATLSVARDRVRSCSGWTKNLFGAPSAEWVACH
jgi:hypothetical protein